MQMVAPVGPMYQAGTLSGNPLAMTAGIETLKELQSPGLWAGIERGAARLAAGLSAAAEDAAAKGGGVPARVQRVGTMFTTFFTGQPVTNWPSAKAADTRQFGLFFRAMLEGGVYLAPSQFEAGFLSSAHSEQEIDFTVRAAETALKATLG
jgi:glutamate-1-semialdehyde 2,1-aminomutase